MNEAYLAYLNSPEWEQLKRTHPSKYECVACESDNLLQMHHMIYRPNLFNTQHSDCCWLCKKCHEVFHRACVGDRFKYKAWGNAPYRVAMIIKAQIEEENMDITPSVIRIASLLRMRIAKQEAS